MLLLIGSISIMASDKFYLKIELLKKERSKDSNSQRYSVEVKDKKVVYKYTYSGFPGAKEKSINRLLSKKELDKIIKSIKENNIDTEVIEIAEESCSPCRLVTLSLVMRIDSKEVKSQISGIYNTHREKERIIKNKNYINSVSYLISSLKGQ